MRERELKFLVGEDFALEDLDVGRRLRLVPAGDTRYDTVYLDTPDLRLAGWGCSLRHRSGQGWTLKLAPVGSGPILEREEIAFPGESAAEGPLAAALGLLTALVRSSTLRPAVRLRTSRRTFQVVDDSGAVSGELTLDDVRVGSRLAQAFREVEFELAADAADSIADRVGKRLRSAGAEPESTSKYLRALGDRAPSEPEIAPIEVGPDSHASELLRAALGRSVSRLLLSDPMVRLGEDIEAVHQARVGVRRLRSSLKAFGPYLDAEWTDDLRAELKWLGGVLGEQRDADVMAERLRDRISSVSRNPQWGSEIVRALDMRRVRAKRALDAALAEPRYVALLDRLVAAAREPALSGGTDPSGRTLAQAVLVPPAGKIRTAVGRLGDDPPDAALHRVRINAKGLRYAAEAVKPVSDRQVERVERAARGVQDVLGEHQDAVVAGSWLHKRAPRAANPAPWARLERAEIAAALASREAWPAAWEKLEQAMSDAGL
jgi:CHAD domain-containing protein